MSFSDAFTPFKRMAVDIIINNMVVRLLPCNVDIIPSIQRSIKVYLSKVHKLFVKLQDKSISLWSGLQMLQLISEAELAV